MITIILPDSASESIGIVRALYKFPFIPGLYTTPKYSEGKVMLKN